MIFFLSPTLSGSSVASSLLFLSCSILIPHPEVLSQCRALFWKGPLIGHFQKWVRLHCCSPLCYKCWPFISTHVWSGLNPYQLQLLSQLCSLSFPVNAFYYFRVPLFSGPSAILHFCFFLDNMLASQLLVIFPHSHLF